MPIGPPAAFFSYCRDDSEFALRLAEELKAAGASVWLDQLDISPGERWDRAVGDAINDCPRMLVILSPASVNSTNVMDEVSFALEARKTVIPILLSDCAIPFRLRRVQYVDFRTDYAGGLKALLKTLGTEHRSESAAAAARASTGLEQTPPRSPATTGRDSGDQETPPSAKNYSNRTGHFIGESLNLTFKRKGQTFLDISQIEDSSGRVTASFGWVQGLYAKGELVENMDESYRLVLVGIVASLRTGSFDCRLIAQFTDPDTIRGEYTLKSRSFWNVDQKGEFLLTRN